MRIYTIVIISSAIFSQTACQIIFIQQGFPSKHVMPARCPRLIIRKARNLYGSGFLNGGGGGIRTHGTLARTTVFKTAPINRSGTPPSNCFECIYILPFQN